MAVPGDADPSVPQRFACRVPRMLWLWLTIFVTGAAILALELLASRIMTPYFGVSLYIWSGILSITLIALALGYAGGGWLARRQAPAYRHDAYLMLPPIAGLALGLAALAYPWLFPRLAELDLVALPSNSKEPPGSRFRFSACGWSIAAGKP